MSVYLGNVQVNILPPMDTQLVDNNYEIISDYNQTWTRPQGWPDLDAIIKPTNMDYIYMTYDTSSDISAIALTILGTNITCSIGHVTNNEFVVDKTLLPTSDKYEEWLDKNSGYPVVRVLGTTITRCYCHSITDSAGHQQTYRKQRIVERVSYIPHMLGMSNNDSLQAWGTYYLQREKISNGDGAALTNLQSVWNGCTNLMDLDLTDFYTPNVATLYYAFTGCVRLQELDLSHWDVKKVVSLYGAFDHCTHLKTLNLSGWETNALTTLRGAFTSCLRLKQIIGIEQLNVTKVTTLQSTFEDCYSLDELPIQNWNITSALTNLYHAFTNCRNIKKLDISNWNISNVTILNSTFAGLRSVTDLSLPAWPTVEVAQVTSMFAYCYNLKYIDLTGLIFHGTHAAAVFTGCHSLRQIHFPNTFSPENVNADGTGTMFANCYSLRKITGIKDWQYNNNSTVTSMFQNCFSLEELDVSNWKTDTITSVSSLFQGCTRLKQLDLSKWQFDNNTLFQNTFKNCVNLTTIGTDGSNWDTSKVTSFAETFRNCYSLKSILNFPQMDLTKVTTMYYCYAECYALEEAIIPNLNLPACTRIDYMFNNCRNLRTVDFSNWTIPAITTNFTSFLSDCRSLTNVIGFFSPKRNINISVCPQMTHQAILVILNALPQTSTARTITIHANVLAMLNTAERTIATDKGWTLAA